MQHGVAIYALGGMLRPEEAVCLYTDDFHLNPITSSLHEAGSWPILAALDMFFHAVLLALRGPRRLPGRGGF